MGKIILNPNIQQRPLVLWSYSGSSYGQTENFTVDNVNWSDYGYLEFLYSDNGNSCFSMMGVPNAWMSMYGIRQGTDGYLQFYYRAFQCRNTNQVIFGSFIYGRINRYNQTDSVTEYTDGTSYLGLRTILGWK